MEQQEFKKYFLEKSIFQLNSYEFQRKSKPIGLEPEEAKKYSQKLPTIHRFMFNPSMPPQNPLIEQMQKAAEDLFNTEANQLKEEMVRHPRSPYIQITHSGLLKSTAMLFQPEEGISREKYNFDLTHNIFYAMFELNKLNGIAEIGFDYIKFFNKDEYHFDNPERSHLYSLGTYRKFNPGSTASETQYMDTRFYWRRFLQEAIFYDLDQHFYSKYLKGQLTRTDLSHLNTVKVKFSNGYEYQNTWFDKYDFGKGRLTMNPQLNPMSPQVTKKGVFWGMEVIDAEKGITENFKLVAEGLDDPSETAKFEPHFSSMIKNALKTLEGLDTVENRGSRKLEPPGSFRTEMRQNLKILIENTQIESISDIISGDINGKSSRAFEIHYPNGDYFKGFKDFAGQSFGQAVYRWAQGYSLEGEFFANVPYGPGKYTDCLGNSIKGYFFMHFFLEEDHGLEHLKRIIKNNHSIRIPGAALSGVKIDSEGLRLLMDPNILKGSRMFENVYVRFSALFRRMNWSTNFFKNTLKSIQDGELDYSYQWKNQLLTYIRIALMTEEAKAKRIILLGMGIQDAKNAFGLNIALRGVQNQGGSNDAQEALLPPEINRIAATGIKAYQKIAAEKEEEKIRELARDRVEESYENILLQNEKEQMVEKGLGSTLDNKTASQSKNHLLLENASKAALLRTQGTIENEVEMTNFRFRMIEKQIKERNRIPLKYRWIDEMRPKKLTAFEKDRILQIVNDDDHIGLSYIYKAYKRLDDPVRLLRLENYKGQNLVMIASFHGNRSMFVDMLNVFLRLKTRSEVVKKILEKRDYEGHNLVDLLCIQGFGIKDELDVGLLEPKYNVETKKIDYTKKSNTVFNKGIKQLYDMDRPLFLSKSKNFKNFSAFVKKMKSDSFSRTSSSVHFLTKRSFCIQMLLKFLKNYPEINLIQKPYYDGKRSNPLHYALFRADLYATLALMRNKMEMLTWRNEKGSLPSDILRYSGEKKNEALAVFASILKEFTRNYNFYVIKKLFLNKDSVLKDQKAKIHGLSSTQKPAIRREDSSTQDQPQTPKERLEAIRSKVDTQKFMYEQVYLFHNSYVMLSKELCSQYVKMLKSRSNYIQNKADHTIMKNYVFVEVSELEALQRNFLDFYPHKFRVEENPELEKEIKETVKIILNWYVFIYGNAEISPEIFDLFDLDPFEKVLKGRNIIHFLCETNSHVLLKRILDHFYSKCHVAAYDPIKYKDYEMWDQTTIDPNKFNELKEKLNIPSDHNLNTPAHFCAKKNSTECLEILMKFDVDLEVINYRGRTAKEILDSHIPKYFNAMELINTTKIHAEIIKYIGQNMLIQCQQHSMAYEFVEGSNSRLKEIIFSSKFELDDEQTQVRTEVLNRVEEIVSDFDKSQQNVQYYLKFIELYNAVLDSKNMDVDVTKIKQSYLRDSDREIERKYNINREGLYSLLSNIEGESHLYITRKDIVEMLFSISILKSIKHFKYTKNELISKKRFLDKIKKIDFSKPIQSSLKELYTMEKLFCIQVQTGAGELVENHFVMTQLNNIRKKYIQYGGGIKMELLKGFPTKGFFGCSKFKNNFFIMISVPDELLKHLSTKYQMVAYNMDKSYHTVFSEFSLESQNLEPLRHYQKVKIMMNLLTKEFDLKQSNQKGIVVKYFPVHDYKKRNMIRKLWAKYKWIVLFRDIFDIIVGKTNRMTLLVLSYITFYHGIQQGFYFAFMAFYTNTLFYLALFGLFGTIMQFFSDLNRDLLLFSAATVVGLWSSLFVLLWRRRESELSYSFDAYEEQRVKEKRTSYRGKSIIDEALLKIAKKDSTSKFKQYFVKKLILKKLKRMSEILRVSYKIIRFLYYWFALC